jgi:murein DD-endopeptidase MepM/ murein hydrolase activator NlpD
MLSSGRGSWSDDQPAHYVISTHSRSVLLISAEYKKFETRFAQAAGLQLRRICASIFNALSGAVKRGGQLFTVMVIPQSENRIFNFQISFFSIIFFTFTISLVLAGLALMATHVRSANAKLKQVSQDFQTSEATLERLRDAVSQIRKAEAGVQSGIRNVQRAMVNQNPLPPSIGDMVDSLYRLSDTGQTSIIEVAAITNATNLMETSAETIGDIGKLLRTYKEFLADTPTLWPLEGVHGVITTRFGWTINPFTRLGYLHEGVDIAWGVGTPIVAAANGIVAQTDYNDSAGNFVAIEHKYGFLTRYFHLMRIATYRGAYVKRGDVIGYLGSTGLSTGPHLHYEVHLGTNYLDPMNFLSIPLDLDTRKTSGVASD